MTYTAVAVLFLLACTVAGALGGRRLATDRVAAAFAGVMVIAQLVLLLTR